MGDLKSIFNSVVNSAQPCWEPYLNLLLVWELYMLVFSAGTSIKVSMWSFSLVHVCELALLYQVDASGGQCRSGPYSQQYDWQPDLLRNRKPPDIISNTHTNGLTTEWTYRPRRVTIAGTDISLCSSCFDIHERLSSLKGRRGSINVETDL